MFELIRAATFDELRRPIETVLEQRLHARGRASIADDHPMFADHFPGVPILPGSIQIELCAQVAGPLLEHIDRVTSGSDKGLAFLAIVHNAKFPAPCPLPADVEIDVELRRYDGNHGTVTATCLRDGITTCRAELTLVLRWDHRPEWAPAIAAARERVARWRKAWTA